MRWFFVWKFTSSACTHARVNVYKFWLGGSLLARRERKLRWPITSTLASCCEDQGLIPALRIQQRAMLMDFSKIFAPVGEHTASITKTSTFTKFCQIQHSFPYITTPITHTVTLVGKLRPLSVGKATIVTTFSH